MLVSKLIHNFSSHLAAFKFWSFTPPDNITLTLANRKADQNLSDFQTGIGATVHATLDTEQLISHLRVALLILCPLCPILREEFYLFQKYMNCFSRFMTFWTMQFPNELGTCSYFSTCVMRSGLCSSLFLTGSGM